MIQAFKKQFSIQWREWCVSWVSSVMFGIFGIILMLVLGKGADGSRQYITMGGLFVLIGVLVIAMVFVLQMRYTFSYVISMGCTRKDFVVGNYLVVLAGVVVGIILAALMCKVESALMMHLYPNLDEVKSLLGIIIRYGWIGAIILTVAICLGGALLLKFGRKAAWVMWAMLMLAALGMPQLIDAAEDAPHSVLGMMGTTILKMFREMSVVTWGAVLFIGAVAGVIITCMILRKQQVVL